MSNTQDAAFQAVFEAFGRHRSPAEIETDAEVDRQMAEVYEQRPDPLEAVEERLAVDYRWLHDTPEGLRVYRRRAQWKGAMRRERAKISEQVVAARLLQSGTKPRRSIGVGRSIVRQVRGGSRRRSGTRAGPSAAARPSRTEGDEPEPPLGDDLPQVVA